MLLSMVTVYFLVVLQSIQIRSQQVESDTGILVVKTIESLTKSISYFKLREERVTADELLGLRIAKEALLKMVENCVGSPGIYVPDAILEDIKVLCAKFNILIPRVLNIYKPTYNMTQSFKKYISSEWRGFLPYKPINVEKLNRIELEIMDKVLPVDFQLCIEDLAQLDKKCIISDNCFKVLQPKMASGSGIVGQAVILSTLQVLGCSNQANDKWKKTTVEELSNDICYKLYPKVSSFHDSDVSQGDDVLSFLNAFFVCTLLGFEDFLQVTHLRISDIIKWQLPSGCFGIEMTVKDGSVRDGRCLPAMTSVAVGQLGLYLKWLVDPKGFTLSSRHQPFKKPELLTFFILKMICVISVLSPFFVRKIRRSLWAVIGRFLSYLKSLFS